MTKPTILNTRPLDLQQNTNDAFLHYGFKTINFPCIEIVSVKNKEKASQQLINIDAYDTVIFTSQYAVRHAYRISPELLFPNETTVICVGIKTAEVLEQHFSGHIWIPEQQNSEGVIDLLNGLVRCQSIKIISADNGRNLIQKYAINNALNFEQINVYKRQLPSITINTVKRLHQEERILILATSQTTLINLKLLTQESWSFLLTQTVACASKRIEQLAKDMGFAATINLQTANSQLIAEKLNASTDN